MLNWVTKSMQREPLLIEAMTRAFMLADPSAATEVNAVAAIMKKILTGAPCTKVSRPPTSVP